MKSLLALAVCLELCTTWVVSLYVAESCTSLENIALAEEAIGHINAGRKHGFKYALDRIENVQKQTQGNTTYYLDVDIRETKCHVLSPKPLAECPIRPFTEIKGDGDCKIILDVSPGNPIHLNGYKCDVTPDSAKDVFEKCPDCPHLISIVNEEVTHAAQVSVDKFNKESTFTHRFDLHEISRSTKGLNSPVHVEFVIKETTCSKHTSACTLNLLLNPIFGFCTSTVIPSSVSEEVFVNCDVEGNKEKAAIGIEGDGTVLPATEDEGTVPPTMEGGTGTPAMEEGGTAPPAIQEECTSSPPIQDGGTAPPALDELGTLTPPIEHQTIVHEETDFLTPEEAAHLIQQGAQSTVPPKRKRSINDDSSESSEELVYSPGKPFVFPDLPEDLTTCPGRHRFHEDQ
ncbi:alpha-2-HS-glycoprotein-like [Amblyraja radiata]|uniref:alpha-2-HS-glycoprotein-like n=1 Tax=Amblyraja radiata TaxID=386614 RepID=UPI0014039862|nr:alpha-2-HS-glycoprotein-like [Amblyraja radiata]